MGATMPLFMKNVLLRRRPNGLGVTIPILSLVTAAMHS